MLGDEVEELSSFRSVQVDGVLCDRSAAKKKVESVSSSTKELEEGPHLLELVFWQTEEREDGRKRRKVGQGRRRRVGEDGRKARRGRTTAKSDCCLSEECSSEASLPTPRCASRWRPRPSP